jgi:DNA-directed RNA polymerase subunit RPC12/RpoP
MKDTKNIGRAICPRCKKEIDLSIFGGDIDMASWDGATEGHHCEHCGLSILISASVEFTVAKE